MVSGYDAHLHEVDLVASHQLGWKKVEGAARVLQWGTDGHGRVEVGEFGDVAIHQNILGFDITVNQHLRLVQVAKPSGNPGESLSTLWFRQQAG